MKEATFKQRLGSVLKDNAIERYQAGKKKGKLNNRRLYKGTTTSKVFKQKEERKGKDYSITLLIDVSGSTSGYIRDTFIETANSLVRVFDSLNIPSSVYTFSDVARRVKDFDEKISPSELENRVKETVLLGYAHCHDCGVFDVDLKEGFLKYGREGHCLYCNKTVRTSGQGCTADSIGLYVTATQIHKKQKKNILLVLTDGDGDKEDADLKIMSPKSKHKLSDLKNAKHTIKLLKKTYPELLIMAVPVRCSPIYCYRNYGKSNVAEAKDAQESFGAIVKLLNRKIKRA